VLLGNAHAKLAHWVRGTSAERDALASAWRVSAAAAGESLAGDRSLARLADALAAELAAAGELRRLEGEDGARALGLDVSPRPYSRDCLGRVGDYTARRL
jgi:hypothetical protein